jgi:zinc protease
MRAPMKSSLFSLLLLCLSSFALAKNPQPAEKSSATPAAASTPIAATPAPASTPAPLQLSLPVTKFQLANGLTVLLLEDHSVPMVSYHTWYRVGSRNETPGVTGAAHMLEHMMFKGAKKYDGKSFDRILHENGITNNAFTTYDYTGFYENLPSSKLELMMDLEVDRMSSLALRADDLTSEREVVKEERRWRVDNNPNGLLRELLMSTVFKVLPYKWPVIGYMKDIDDYTVEKLRFFYNTYYIPNNAVLVLVGDFKTAETRALIEKYYGGLPYKPLPSRDVLKERTQTVQQNASLKKDVQNRSFVVAFQGVPQDHPDMYALDLLSNLLGSGTSSRLYRRLVYQKQSATSSYAFDSTMKDSGVFGIGINLKPGLAVKDSLDVVYNEIWKARNQKISAAELEKLKTQVMKESVDNLRTMDGKARSLAVNEILTGTYESLFTDLPKYQAVTADDVKRVAEKYLNQTQRSIIVLEPQGKRE